MTHNPDHFVCCGFPIIVDRSPAAVTGDQAGIWLRRGNAGLPYLSARPHARIGDVALAAAAASRGEYLTNDRSATSAKE